MDGESELGPTGFGIATARKIEALPSCMVIVGGKALQAWLSSLPLAFIKDAHGKFYF